MHTDDSYGEKVLTTAISQAALVEFVTGQKRVSNIPHDARVVSAWFDLAAPPREGLMLVMKLEHVSFPAVEPGRRLPNRRAKFRKSTGVCKCGT